MRDQRELALRCLEVEKSGASVIDFLTGMGFISPRATWERLQLNELGRKANDIEKKKEKCNMAKLTLEIKKKAVQIALDGGDYLAYLKEHGAKNPSASWAYIMECAKKNDQNNYLQLKARLDEKAAKKTETHITTTKDKIEVRVEQPAVEDTEAKQKVKKPGAAMRFAPDGEHLEKINKPLQYEDFTVRAVEGVFGRYARDIFNGADYIDFESKEGDELHMRIDGWKNFIGEMKRAAKVLGVDLDDC